MERPRLLSRLRNAIRVRNLSTSTERAHVHWVRRYILFHRKRHPSELEENDVRRFLTFLAVERRVAASTQRGEKGTYLLFDYGNRRNENGSGGITGTYFSPAWRFSQPFF